jgi:hypothetical protein
MGLNSERALIHFTGLCFKYTHLAETGLCDCAHREWPTKGRASTPLTQRITFIDLRHIVLDRRFRRLRIASYWRSLSRYRMFNRNQIFSHNDLFDQQPHDSLALINVKGIGI